MKFQVLFAFAAFAFSGASANQTSYKIVKQELVVSEDLFDFGFKNKTFPGLNVKISNGASAVDGQFPWAARLAIFISSNSYYQCSGSLISTKFIVSARHCIAGVNAVSAQALLGAADINNPGRTIASIDYFWWLDYSDGNHPDIALFRLKSPVTLNSKIQTIRLPARSQEFQSFEGWSVLNEGYGGGRSVLQYGKFKILSNSQCRFRDIVICSVPENAVASLEGGDSGGPMTAVENGTPTLLGINVVIVWGNGFRYMQSTRTSRFLQFINDVTGVPIR